jgi:heterodisulfide reductase subunit A-like polyferredoxin
MGFARGAQVGPIAAILPVSPANTQGTPPARDGSRLVAVVDADKCTGCGICSGFCPSQAISVDAVATIDAKRCTGCGESVAVCAARALSVTLRALAKRSSARNAIG